MIRRYNILSVDRAHCHWNPQVFTAITGQSSWREIERVHRLWLTVHIHHIIIIYIDITAVFCVAVFSSLILFWIRPSIKGGPLQSNLHVFCRGGGFAPNIMRSAYDAPTSLGNKWRLPPAADLRRRFIVMITIMNNNIPSRRNHHYDRVVIYRKIP